ARVINYASGELPGDTGAIEHHVCAGIDIDLRRADGPIKPGQHARRRCISLDVNHSGAGDRIQDFQIAKYLGDSIEARTGKPTVCSGTRERIRHGTIDVERGGKEEQSIRRSGLKLAEPGGGKPIDAFLKMQRAEIGTESAAVIEEQVVGRRALEKGL